MKTETVIYTGPTTVKNIGLYNGKSYEVVYHDIEKKVSWLHTGKGKTIEIPDTFLEKDAKESVPPLKVSMENMPKLNIDKAIEKMKEIPVPVQSGVKIETGDIRYNVPKEKPKFSTEEIDRVIADNEIYRRTRSEIERNAQREQVGYGMGKYPEPLNADTWTIIETLGHIKGEIMDALHYITMLEIKFEKMG